MKERREVFGIYDWYAKKWWVADVEKRRLTFDDYEKAIAHLKEADWHVQSSVRRFFLVKKKPLDGQERVKSVVNAARAYAVYMGGKPCGEQPQFALWRALSVALEEYDSV